jgi:DNA-binding response OmpR family regulator
VTGHAVLLVEDEAVTRSSIARYLRASGYDVRETETVAQTAPPWTSCGPWAASTGPFP